MKVGIVTIFDNNNHGNRLQNYALQQILLRYTDQVVTMKNKPWYSEKSRIARMLPLAESAFLNRVLGMERRGRIVEFTNRHVRLSRSCYWYDKDGQAPKKADRCDVYCIGSDQIWNPTMGRGGSFDYMTFAPSERIFSYAASFGIDEIPEEYQNAVAAGLNHIKHISVREDAGKRIVETLTGRTDAQVLVDPTMLLTKEEWDQVIAMPKAQVPENFLLTYFLGGVSEERRAAIMERAEQLGCELVEVMNPNSPFYAVGPHEFVWLIKNAKYICTDSFHGSVFSFLYGKPFAVFARTGKGPDMGSRLKTFMDKFSLQACAAVETAMPEYCAEPDYSTGYAALEMEREKSKLFLDNVFKG
jgi:hypothetical protein